MTRPPQARERSSGGGRAASSRRPRKRLPIKRLFDIVDMADAPGERPRFVLTLQRSPIVRVLSPPQPLGGRPLPRRKTPRPH